MSRPDVNRFAEMAVFVRIIELGGFSAAARDCDMTPSAVSKLIGRLERRLGVRLIQRSTRRLQLTAEGCAFYESSRALLTQLVDAETSIAASALPQGPLRISCNHSFAVHFLLPLVPEFAQQFPDIELDLVLTDRVEDLLETRADIAIRAGALRDSALMARRLGQTRLMLAATPEYLQRAGRPRTLDDLAAHRLIALDYRRAVNGWPLQDDGGRLIEWPVPAALRLSDGEAVRALCLGGAGIARLAEFRIRQALLEGQLEAVLPERDPGLGEEFHAVFVGSRGQMPARVRVMLDFLAARVDFAAASVVA